MKNHKLILDTNIFNWILDNKIQISDFPENSEFFVTNIQVGELQKTPDSNRKSELKKVFQVIEASYLPTETFVLGYAHLDSVKIGDGAIYIQILEDLNSGKKKNSNICDALISEVAIINKLELVTKDGFLRKVHLKHGGMLFDNFLK